MNLLLSYITEEAKKKLIFRRKFERRSDKIREPNTYFSTSYLNVYLPCQQSLFSRKCQYPKRILIPLVWQLRNTIRFWSSPACRYFIYYSIHAIFFASRKSFGVRYEGFIDIRLNFRNKVNGRMSTYRYFSLLLLL